MKECKQIAIIADNLTLPIDEGLKKLTFKMMEYGLRQKDVDVYSSPENVGLSGISLYKANKLMFNNDTRSIFRGKSYTDVYYIPEASATFGSFIRAWMLCQLNPNKRTKFHIVCSQKRLLKKWQIQFVKKLKRIDVICFSSFSSNYYHLNGIEAINFSNGVDADLFCPVPNNKKRSLRLKYDLPLDRKIVLHVGHIRESRNIKSLICLQELGFQVVIVGSTSMAYESKVATELTKSGVQVISEYNPCIEEMYQLSDLYVFPVVKSDAAIEFPLSVLEAMSCELPVITTKYGTLPEIFEESKCFKYYNEENELQELAKQFNDEHAAKNREIVLKDFTWDTVFKKMLDL